LPRVGGTNLWKLVRRFQRLFNVKSIGRDRLAKFCSKNGFKVGRRKSRKIQTTFSKHNYAVQPYLLPGVEITAPGQVLVADITYIPLYSGHTYLFLVTDAYSRMIVGHHLSDSLNHNGAIEALKMALELIPKPQGVIHHSDRGCQYCCHDFLEQVHTWELRASMTDKDHCAQNALAECMNGILKTEFLLDAGFISLNHAKLGVSDAIFNYNCLRIHGQLDGKTPEEVHTGYPSGLLLWANELRLNLGLPLNSCVNSI
jgi:putative transposase